MVKVTTCQCQLKRDNRFVKTVHTKKINKLHKFASCNLNFEKSRLSDMHYPTPDIYVKFEINWPVSYSATAFQSISYERRTDRQTDGRTDIANLRGTQETLTPPPGNIPKFFPAIWRALCYLFPINVGPFLLLLLLMGRRSFFHEGCFLSLC